MAKWVTGYWNIMSGVSSLKVHDNKEDATKYFKYHYSSEFQLSSPIKVKLPMTYGFAFRKYFGITKRAFEKQFGSVEDYIKPQECV